MTALASRSPPPSFTLDPRKLVFVTGRGLESVMPLLADPTIPTPDYIIADVGASVVHGDLRPVEPLQHEIAARWPGSQVVLRALKSCGPSSACWNSTRNWRARSRRCAMA